MASGVAPVINIVEFLLKKTFERFKWEEKLEIKQLGPDRPDINIIMVYSVLHGGCKLT